MSIADGTRTSKPLIWPSPHVAAVVFLLGMLAGEGALALMLPPRPPEPPQRIVCRWDARNASLDGTCRCEP